MEILTFLQFTLTRPNPSVLPLAPPSSFLRSPSRSALLRNPRVSIRPPPPEFDFKSEILEESRSAVASAKPELTDLAEDGTLVLVEKRRFGPVPAWRSEFVEPDAIWLIGTSHLSEESAADVERVVRALRPENVVVELCRSRAGIMYASKDVEDGRFLKSNMFSISGAKFFGTVNRSLNLGGQSALALRLLLAIFSSKISSGANRPFGDEFRAARKASEEVGAQIVLGDRPIEITLERSWSSLMWWERLKLLTSLFRGIFSPSLELPEGYLKVVLFLTFAALQFFYLVGMDREMDGSSFQLYAQLSTTYPSLLQPLIHERDTYLAWSLKRSKAVNNSKNVVGVIGKGHMNGVVYSLITDLGDLRFRDLVGRASGDSSKGWISAALRNLFRDAILTFILWAFYEQLKANL